MTMPPDLLAHNKQLIIQFRADGGASMGNRPLLLLTTLGRRSGQKRTSPMMYVRSDDDCVLVIASNNGAPADPLWYRNLIADPHVTVELPGQEFAATAEPLTGADYDREWARIKEKFPFFADHELRSAGRQIPVVALNRAG
jgi:deazaflavin-dependent oxidoreductase (nitroreductase family)